MMLTLEFIGAWTEDNDDKPREPETDSVYSMQHPGERLHKEILFIDSIGEALVSDYVKRFTLSKVPVAEGEKTRLVPRDYSAAGSEALQQKKVALAISTSETLVAGSGSINDLKNELNKFRGHVSDDEFPDFNKFKLKKEYVAALAKVRTKAFATNEALPMQLKKEADVAGFGGKGTPEDRQTEL